MHEWGLEDHQVYEQDSQEPMPLLRLTIIQRAYSCLVRAQQQCYDL